MKVLVTGATGFLGRRLIERLLDCDRSVTFLGRTPMPEWVERGARFVHASLEDRDAVRAACAGMETVFHIAAKVGVWGPYDDYYRVNVLGTRALLEGCRQHGVPRFVYTSTPSVVYNGYHIMHATESMPLTELRPNAYVVTKTMAEREVLAANTPSLRTTALRPHLIWGVGDPHLVPRVLARARQGRLWIVGDGKNRVDMVHVENAVDAHLLAEDSLGWVDSIAAGKPYFITNQEPVLLWDWINQLLIGLGEKPIRKHVSLKVAHAAGAVCEAAWRMLPLRGEPPLTRFVADELARDHFFNIKAAQYDLGYQPRVSMAEGTAELIAHLKQSAAAPLRTR